jgi:uncharacterized protein (TIGR02757 family)
MHPDPVEVVHRYASQPDREVVALLAASLAYGRARQILASLDDLLERLSPSPSAWLDAAGARDLLGALEGFRHRWTRAEDVAELLAAIRVVRARYGGLEACFVQGLRPDAPHIMPALGRWVDCLRGAGSGRPGLLADPAGGSACKRLHLFLRWMVRRDSIDPGGWDGVPASLLLVPVDTHMHRWGLRLGFTRRRRADLSAVYEISDAFRRMAPEDPVRYDFALTRLAMREASGPHPEPPALDGAKPPVDHCLTLPFSLAYGSASAGSAVGRRAR